LWVIRASAALQSNRVTLKCSQMELRKDRFGTSTGSSPPTSTPTPRITTTYPTATSKMDPIAPKRTTQKHQKTTIPGCPQVPGTRTRKYPQHRPWTIHHSYQEMRAKSEMTRGQLRYPSDRPAFPDNLHFRPDNGSPRMGKVAIIRDVAAVTCVEPAVN